VSVQLHTCNWRATEWIFMKFVLEEIYRNFLANLILIYGQFWQTHNTTFMCCCSLEHSPAFSAHVHWHPYCMHACEIYAIYFSTVSRNLEKHIICGTRFVEEWLNCYGWFCLHLFFLWVVVFVMPFAICLSYFLVFVVIPVFLELHVSWVTIQNSV
jgi:hypothetical protein